MHQILWPILNRDVIDLFGDYYVSMYVCIYNNDENTSIYNYRNFS